MCCICVMDCLGCIVADLTDGSDECLDRIAAYLSQLPAPKIEVVMSNAITGVQHCTKLH